MRVPYAVPRQTLRAYDCSKETGRLKTESRRLLKAESDAWDKKNAPTLKQLAVKALVQNFSGRTPLDCLPTEDFQQLLETLPATVPLEVSVPLVPDGVYWHRLASLTWPSTNNVVAEHGGSWRRLVLERRLQQELEAALPPMLDEALRLARLAGPHVRRLRLDRLLQTALTQPAAGHAANLDYPALAPLALPGGWTPDLPTERRELHMFDTELDALQEDLCNLLGCLTNLEELDVMFGMHDFEKNLSEPPNVVKVACCEALGKTLSTLQAFRRLRVRRSQLHLEKLAGLLEPMHGSASLTELDLSHCYLDDKGVQVVSAFLLDQASLRVLRLVNDKFGARGATTLAKSLLSKTCPPLVELDVSLNSIGDVGGHNVLMALFPRDNRMPLRDPAEDEHVREMMQAEEKERLRRAAEATEDEPSHEGITIFRGLVQRAIAGELPLEVPAAGTSPSAAEDRDEWDVEPEDQVRKASALMAVIAEARHFQREEAAAAEEACGAVVRALRGNPRVLQLDLRMCGASWADQAGLERAVGANNAALRKPLPLRDMLAEREGYHRLRLATTTEVLGPAFTGSASTGGFSGLSQGSQGHTGSALTTNSAATPNGPAGLRQTKPASNLSQSQLGSGSGMASLRSGSRRAESSTLSQPSHLSGMSKGGSNLTVK
ncbi:uncharacterized protein LOC117649564 [Thrips palmi]|uniref:Uncharacterized protein LOC117649564 n=1 Tax=Thrips palmi TaxID=161013 RepID=A0A6P8ZSZ0_THRPL|nr:uncharacterized protein LOC117649564 [Thrips palmi]